MERKQIRVAWICHFSNAKVREKLHVKENLLRKLVYKIKGKAFREGTDMAVWNSNAIEEMEKMESIELHVICPVRDLGTREVRYVENGIYYYFFREQDSSLLNFSIHHLFIMHSYRWKTNRSIIKNIISEIKPDIVHVFGAENPFYSLAILDIPKTTPTIIQLQTLLSRLVDVTDVKSQKIDFYYKGQIEQEIFNKATFIATGLKEFGDYILANINPRAKILNLFLAMGNKINLEPCEKEFDFVYFANDISKAADVAIEAFILAHKKNPQITLDIVGSYKEGFKKELRNRLSNNNAIDAVFFEGRLPTHSDVIKQIRKAKFALIPLKIDFVPNTIREAMANGLPVVTTVTDGTPALNIKRESVLLSGQGDYQAMADNMLKLMADDKLQSKLRQNAALTDSEYMNNKDIVQSYCDAYRACIDYFCNNIPIPSNLLF